MSQFVVITHNKKTVTGASALLGVTMEESGVTKVIAVRLEHSDGKVQAPDVPLNDIAEEEVEYEDGKESPPDLDDGRREGPFKKPTRQEKKASDPSSDVSAPDALPEEVR
jgi:chromosome segregation protein